MTEDRRANENALAALYPFLRGAGHDAPVAGFLHPPEPSWFSPANAPLPKFVEHIAAPSDTNFGSKGALASPWI